MTISPPGLFSLLSVPQQANNFIALQSAKLTVGTASTSVVFTNIPSANRITFKITNTNVNAGGTVNSSPVGVYLASGSGSATAVASSTTPTPTTGTNAVSTCDFIGGGAIITQDYIAGTTTLAGITAAGSAVLEISIGTGQ